MRRKNIFLLTLALIFLISASAPRAQYVKMLTLNEAISLAKNNNSELVNARLDRMKATEKVSEVYSENLVPTMTLNSRYNRTFFKQVFDIFGQKIEIGTDNSIQTTIDVSEPIPILGTPVFSGIRIAEYYAKLQDESVKSAESKVKTDVKKAFYTVLLANEVVNVNKLSLQNSTDNLALVETKYKNGVVTEFDFLRAKVKVETVKPGLSQAESNLILSKKFLKNTIGLKTIEEIDVTGKLTYDSSEVWGNTDDIITKIAEKNVAIRQLNISKLINQELVTIDNANYLPKFYLFGQYGFTANENDDRRILEFRFNNTLNAGIGLTWDLNLFKNSFKKAQSVLEVKKNEETIADVKQKLKIQSQSIILRMDDAKKRIISQSETVKLAERGLDLANISYKGGVLNQIDVLDAELLLNQTRLGYNQAIFDYLNAKAELEGLLEN